MVFEWHPSMGKPGPDPEWLSKLNNPISCLGDVDEKTARAFNARSEIQKQMRIEQQQIAEHKLRQWAAESRAKRLSNNNSNNNNNNNSSNNNNSNNSNNIRRSTKDKDKDKGKRKWEDEERKAFAAILRNEPPKIRPDSTPRSATANRLHDKCEVDLVYNTVQGWIDEMLSEGNKP